MFLATFLIMLREGLEAVLIVSLIAGYLTKTGNHHWMRYVWFGIVAALACCTALAVTIYFISGEIPQRSQELFEGIIALVAVVILTYMVFWMRKAARSLKQALTSQIDNAIAQDKGKGIALIAMVFFAVAREGVEALFFLFSFFEQDGYVLAAVGGSITGLASAVILGVTLYKGAVHLNLSKFFRYTGVLILFIAAGMAASGLRSLHEAGVWNNLQRIVFDVSDTIVAQYTILGSLLAGFFGFNDHPTQGEVYIYFLYLIPALIFFFWPSQTVSSPKVKKST